MAKPDLTFQVKMDKKAVEYFQKEAPEKLKLARRRAVEAAGMVWADEAKQITRDDDHILTSLYINSIGYVTSVPGKEPGRQAGEGDVIHELMEETDRTILKTGSAVAYAGHLEKKYNIMARALDTSQDRMQKVAQTQIQQTLFGGAK